MLNRRTPYIHRIEETLERDSDAPRAPKVDPHTMIGKTVQNVVVGGSKTVTQVVDVDIINPGARHEIVVYVLAHDGIEKNGRWSAQDFNKVWKVVE